MPTRRVLCTILCTTTQAGQRIARDSTRRPRPAPASDARGGGVLHRLLTKASLDPNPNPNPNPNRNPNPNSNRNPTSTPTPILTPTLTLTLSLTPTLTTTLILTPNSNPNPNPHPHPNLLAKAVGPYPPGDSAAQDASSAHRRVGCSRRRCLPVPGSRDAADQAHGDRKPPAADYLQTITAAYYHCWLAPPAPQIHTRYIACAHVPSRCMRAGEQPSCPQGWPYIDLPDSDDRRGQRRGLDYQVATAPTSQPRPRPGPQHQHQHQLQPRSC